MQNKKLDFYMMMKYPIPDQEQYFYYKNKYTKKINPPQKNIYNIATQIRKQKINKYNRLRRNLPYIEHIYLCDSISFNAADE